MERSPNGDASMARESRSNHDLSTVKKIPFNVVYCSGQDEDFPASELNKDVSGRGWHSSRYCYYPQELVLELQWPSRIINMQLLCHEFKIPTKVEVFVNLMVPYVHCDEAVSQMKRLGYLSLDPNERSGHQARELKSIYVDAPATVVRLVLHNCYSNNLNIYNQVGLMALILTGEPLDEQQWALLNQPGFAALLQTPRKQGPSFKAVDARIQVPSPKLSNCNFPAVDESTASHILQLQEEKNIAVLDEDYDEAKRLKVMIERLKVIGEQIRQLEGKKKAAVESEDYDAAKACKFEIEKLRQIDTLPQDKGQTKNDGALDCDFCSKESAYHALLAEGLPQEECPHQKTPEMKHSDFDKRESGTQTHHDKYIVMKVDKEVTCKTTDLKPPLKQRSGAVSVKCEEKKLGLLSSVFFSWWRGKSAHRFSRPKSPSMCGEHDPFIPAMTGPNLLHAAGAPPAFSYQNEPATFLQVMAHTYTHENAGSLSFPNENLPPMLPINFDNFSSPPQLMTTYSVHNPHELPTFYNRNDPRRTQQMPPTFLNMNGSTFITHNGQPTMQLPPLMSTTFNHPQNALMMHHRNLRLIIPGQADSQGGSIPSLKPTPSLPSSDYMADQRLEFANQNSNQSGTNNMPSTPRDSCHPELSTPSIASNNNDLVAMSTKASSNMDNQSGHASTPKTMEPRPNSTIEQKRSPATKGQQSVAFNNEKEDDNNFKTSSSSALYALPPPRANSDDTLTPEPLTEALMVESRPLLAVLDLYHVECFHSKQWQLRDKALHFITQELKTYSLEGEALAIFRVLDKVITRALNDRVANVFNSAMQLLRLFVTRYAAEVPTTDLRNCMSDMVKILLEKLGDSNVRTRDACSEALMFLASKKEIGFHIIAIPLLRPPKNQGIWRLILGRLQLLLLAIPTFGLQPPNKMGVPTEPLMAFVGQAFNSANGDVRNAAVKVTTEVYRLMGAPVEKYLKNVKPLVREVINENFERAAQETQDGIYPVVEIAGSDFAAPPLRCAPKVMQFHFDDQPVGPPKRTKHVIGKVTSGDLVANATEPTEPPPRAEAAPHLSVQETLVGPPRKAKSKGPLMHPHEFDVDVGTGHGKKCAAKTAAKATRASASSIQVCVQESAMIDPSLSCAKYGTHNITPRQGLVHLKKKFKHRYDHSTLYVV